jgi:GTP-binding protein
MAEKLSVVMARKHIEQADVVLMVIDAIEGVTALDANIAGYAHEAGRSVILVVNKWDAVEKDTWTVNAYEEKIRASDEVPRLRADHLPLRPDRAACGQAAGDHRPRQRGPQHCASPPVSSTSSFTTISISPGRPSPASIDLKILYLTQAGIRPPTFVIFTSGTKTKIHFSYERYLINRLRESLRLLRDPDPNQAAEPPERRRLESRPLRRGNTSTTRFLKKDHVERARGAG